MRISNVNKAGVHNYIHWVNHRQIVDKLGEVWEVLVVI